MREADEAVAAGLLDTDPATGDLVFRHPLIRTTVVRLATPNQRRAAHAELAGVHRHDVERRARHLAALDRGSRRGGGSRAGSRGRLGDPARRRDRPPWPG
ncbi:hypothetical protein [Nonomuraea dietziae]|uniref:hypothetical protein n=1 Tax=Nonomuraea dietziae TaxID=65515 RepID=UPI0031E1B125